MLRNWLIVDPASVPDMERVRSAIPPLDALSEISRVQTTVDALNRLQLPSRVVVIERSTDEPSLISAETVETIGPRRTVNRLSPNGRDRVLWVSSRDTAWVVTLPACPAANEFRALRGQSTAPAPLEVHFVTRDRLSLIGKSVPTYSGGRMVLEDC